MATSKEETIWVKTHAVLNDFFQVLTCKKCQRKLCNPKNFLNCGHFACAECVGSNTDCIQCKVPGDASDVHSDKAIQELLNNLNIISETIGFECKHPNQYCEPETTSASKEKNNVSKKGIRQLRKPSISQSIMNDTLNASISESVVSKSTLKSKLNESIPKNINKKNKKGETPLHIACRSNQIERVKKLLEAGASPNTKDNAGWTPLQEAANYEFNEICEILLKNGALPNMYGYDNRTALHEAVISNNYELVSLLLKANVDKNVCDNVGKKPRDYCVTEQMRKLLENIETDVVNKDHSLDLDKTVTESSKVILYGSDLKPKNKKLLIRLSTQQKLKLVNNFSSIVTHVIVETDATSNIKLSYDILLTILHGKWLLNSDCLYILLESENVTANDLNLFEVSPPQLDDSLIRSRENVEKQNPKLFHNCYFYFATKNTDSQINYDNLIMTKENLIKLASAGDGITMTREPKPEDIQGSLSPFHVANNPKHSLHKCTHYIIYFPESNQSNTNRIMYNLPFLKTLPLMWFIESILRFQLIDPIDLGLVPE